MPVAITLSDDDVTKLRAALTRLPPAVWHADEGAILNLDRRLALTGDQTGAGEAIQSLLGTNAAFTPQGNVARKAAQDLLKKIGAT